MKVERGSYCWFMGVLIRLFCDGSSSIKIVNINSSLFLSALHGPCLHIFVGAHVSYCDLLVDQGQTYHDATKKIVFKFVKLMHSYTITFICP